MRCGHDGFELLTIGGRFSVTLSRRHQQQIQRRAFLRLAASAPAALALGGILDGCGSANHAGSAGLSRVEKYKVHFLFPIADGKTASGKSQKRSKAVTPTRQSTVNGAPAGVRLGKINSVGDVAATIDGTSGESAALYHNGAVVDATLPIAAPGGGSNDT